MYLVMLHHHMDDFPVRLFDTLEDALAFADAVEPMPTDNIRKVFCTDASTPNCVSVVTFMDGIPTCNVLVKAFD